MRVTVKTGVSDDNNTEVSSEDLFEGDEIILERKSAAELERQTKLRMPH